MLAGRPKPHGAGQLQRAVETSAWESAVLDRTRPSSNNAIVAAMQSFVIALAHMATRRPRQAGTALRRPRRSSPRRRSVLGNDSFPVVGLGASAGGLDAARRLLASLPAGSGMAFILIQHLDPTHASMMVD